MTAPRPTFRVMKNGYDRFAVDDAVERYAAEVDRLQKQLKFCQQQMDETNARLEQLKANYQQMSSSMDARKQAADDIARLSLREANQIIATAQDNADSIIKESLATARLILTDLSKLYNDAGTVKTGMRDRLNGLITEIDDFRIPQMPDLRWLSEAEKKMNMR